MGRTLSLKSDSILQFLEVTIGRLEKEGSECVET